MRVCCAWCREAKGISNHASGDKEVVPGEPKKRRATLRTAHLTCWANIETLRSSQEEDDASQR